MQTYWEECIADAFEEAGISSSSDQRNKVSEFISRAHKMYGESTGESPDTKYMISDVDKYKKLLDEEIKKVTCKNCSGSGMIYDLVGTSHYSREQCYVCDGKGRL